MRMCANGQGHLGQMTRRDGREKHSACPIRGGNLIMMPIVERASHSTIIKHTFRNTETPHYSETHRFQSAIVTPIANSARGGQPLPSVG
jgi:hypothetical protein